MPNNFFYILFRFIVVAKQGTPLVQYIAINKVDTMRQADLMCDLQQTAGLFHDRGAIADKLNDIMLQIKFKNWPDSP